VHARADFPHTKCCLNRQLARLTHSHCVGSEPRRTHKTLKLDLIQPPSCSTALMWRKERSNEAAVSLNRFDVKRLLPIYRLTHSNVHIAQGEVDDAGH